MKAMFMSQDKNNLEMVFSRETRVRLAKKLEFFDDFCDISTLDARSEQLRETEVIFSTWGMFSLTSEQIAKYLPKLKAIYYGAGTVQAFARPFIEAGVAVHSAWAANAVPVAEFTVAQIILANKGYFQRFHRPSNGTWCNRRAVIPFTGNYGNKIGLIGIGMIGSLVAEMLKTYKFEVLAFDPFLSAERAKELNIELTSLERIFSECTVISNHLANNPQTVGMLNGKLFGRMMKNAAFINTGRGAQVVEADLIAAMEAEPQRVALLDVTLPEPPEADSKLYTMPNVFLSPHIAGSLGNEVSRMGEYMCDEFMRVENGGAPKWQVSLKMLETMA